MHGIPLAKLFSLSSFCLWEIPVLAADGDLHQCHPTGLVSPIPTFPSSNGIYPLPNCHISSPRELGWQTEPGLIHTCLPGKEGMSPCFSLCFLLAVTVGHWRLPCQPGAPAVPGAAASSPSSLSLTQFHRVAAIPELRALTLRGRNCSVGLCPHCWG